MQAYKKFQLEMEQLEILHLGTLYAYDQAILRVKDRIEQGFVDPADSITRTISPTYKYEVVASSAETLQQQLKRQFPEYLREILLVRVISILEVFLIDTIKEIFLARKDLFHKDEKVDFSYAQLLSFSSISEIATHIINKECRTLQNGGFIKVSNYYKSRFNIDFKSHLSSSGLIMEYHDRRHLIVHRLGKTDKQYRQKYNTSDKSIKISKSYIINCFEAIRSFGTFVAQEAQSVIQDSKKAVGRREPTAIVMIELKIISEEGKEIISSYYNFVHGDEILSAKDLIVSISENESNHYFLELHGQIKQVQAYLKQIKQSKRDGFLQVIDLNFVRWIGSKKRQLPNDFLDKIAETLPREPWTADIHKQIASKFGITSRQAKQAIKRIKARDVSNNIIQQVELCLPPEPWPIGIHAEIAETLGISNIQAYEAIKKIRISRAVLQE
jgi:hypothetical protein